MAEIKETLAARGTTHGSFEETAFIAQSMTNIMRCSPNWDSLSVVHKEALEMIQHKIARMLCGDPWFLDSIRDVIGYAELLQTFVAAQPQATDAVVSRVRKENGDWQPWL